MTFRFASSLMLVVALAGAVACSSAAPSAAPGKSVGDVKEGDKEKDDDDKGKDDDDDDDKGKDDDDAKPGDKKEIPYVIHTGFAADSPTKFRVPLSMEMSGKITWKVADPSIADVVSADAPPWYAEVQKEEPDLKLQFGMLTAKKVGKTKITVSNGETESEADLEVVAYTAAQIAVGETRYKKGEGTANRRPCAGCHESQTGTPHDPYWVSGLSDEEILHSVTVGSYEWDGKTHEINGGNHKWNLTDAEKTGILAYLRSRNPEGFDKL